MPKGKRGPLRLPEDKGGHNVHLSAQKKKRKEEEEDSVKSAFILISHGGRLEGDQPVVPVHLQVPDGTGSFLMRIIIRVTEVLESVAVTGTYPGHISAHHRTHTTHIDV